LKEKNGEISVIAFPECYTQYMKILKVSEILSIFCITSRNHGETVKFVAENIKRAYLEK
jgi:hypothetical protein